jgi:crossover junction endodeoxyribonuclease RusA
LRVCSSDPAGIRADRADDAAQELSLIIPGIPPTVNHYVKHTRDGRHYQTAEGKDFKQLIAITAARREIRAKRYELEVTVYLGHGQRGDGDNFWKVTADGLVKAGVIHSDAAVSDWIMHVRRDRDNPRTEITIRALE